MRLVGALLVCSVLSVPAKAQDDLTFGVGFSAFGKQQTDLDSLTSVQFINKRKNGFYWGYQVNFSDSGTATGVYSDGLMAGKIFPINDRFYVDTNMYIATVSDSNDAYGLLYRPAVHIGRNFNSFSLSTGFSWTKISGSPVSTPSFDLTFRTPMNFASKQGHDERGIDDFENRLKFKSYSAFIQHQKYRGAIPVGGVLPTDKQLSFGAEFVLGHNDTWDYFLNTSGAIKSPNYLSGEVEKAYVDMFIGARKHFEFAENASFFVDAAIGFGGRGTPELSKRKSGPLLAYSAGVKVPITSRIFTSLAMTHKRSMVGPFKTWSPTASLGFVLGGKTKKTQEKPVEKNVSYMAYVEHMPDLTLDNNVTDAPGSQSFIMFKINIYNKNKSYFTFLNGTTLTSGAKSHPTGFGFGKDISLSDSVSFNPEVVLSWSPGQRTGKYRLRQGIQTQLTGTFNFRLDKKVDLQLGGGYSQGIFRSDYSAFHLRTGLKFNYTTFH